MISASVAHSIEVDEKLQTEKIVYKPSHDIYALFFKYRAGVYHSSKKHLPCLKKSLESQKEVLISFNPKSLVISQCQIE
jgi:hypothetical protein